MTSYPKRLIEVDLPIKHISEHARREKSISHGHISTLHVWWARRPQAACRAVLCASLWPDPVDTNCPQLFRDEAARILCDFADKVRTDAEVLHLSHSHWSRWHRTTPVSLNPKLSQCWPDMRYALLDFIADFANWDASTTPIFLETARALTQAAHESLGGISGTRPLVVDPFAGGGSIPLEALRVGADTFASDLNPIAVMLNKVVLEYVPKYGQQLTDQVRKGGKWIKEQIEQELAEFYPKDSDGAIPISYLWARTITCEGPGCGAEIPLMRSLWLAKKASNSVALRIVLNTQGKGVDFEIIQDAKIRDVNEGTIRRGSATCPVCGYTTSVVSIRKQLQAHQGGAREARLFAVVTTRPGQQGRFYRLPTARDLEAVFKSRKELEQRQREYLGSLSLVPDEPLPPQGTLGFRIQLYGMEQWGNLFTSRQALALTTLVRIVSRVPEYMIDVEPGLVEATGTCLGLAVDRLADFNSNIARWANNRETSAATFGRHALGMIWDYCETVPISESTGSLSGSVEWILRICESITLAKLGVGQVRQASAANHPLPDDSASLIFTDPPYYDAVPYANLSDFFYVWLKRSIKELHPNLLSYDETPKEDEAVKYG